MTIRENRVESPTVAPQSAPPTMIRWSPCRRSQMVKVGSLRRAAIQAATAHDSTSVRLLTGNGRQPDVDASRPRRFAYRQLRNGSYTRMENSNSLAENWVSKLSTMVPAPVVTKIVVWPGSSEKKR